MHRPAPVSDGLFPLQELIPRGVCFCGTDWNVSDERGHVLSRAPPTQRGRSVWYHSPVNDPLWLSVAADSLIQWLVELLPAHFKKPVKHYFSVKFCCCPVGKKKKTRLSEALRAFFMFYWCNIRLIIEAVNRLINNERRLFRWCLVCGSLCYREELRGIALTSLIFIAHPAIAVTSLPENKAQHQKC